MPYNVAGQVLRLGVREKATLDNSPRFTPSQWQAVRDRCRRPRPDNVTGEWLRFCTLFVYALRQRIKQFASHTHYHIVQTSEREWLLKVIGKGLRGRRVSLERVDHLALEALEQYRTFLKLPDYPTAKPCSCCQH